MDCYEYPYIALQGLCDDVKPSSGLFVNSISGMNIDRVNAVTGDDFINVKQKYKAIHDNAMMCLKEDYLNLLREKLELKGVLETKMTGSYGSDMVSIDGRIGFEVKTDTDDCLKKARVNHIKLYASQAVAKTFFLVDGVVRKEKTIQLSKGLNTIRFNWTVEACNAFIYFNPCDLELGEKCSTSCGANCNCNCSCTCNDCITVSGIKLTIEDDNIDFNYASVPMQISVSCVCDPCELFCMNLDALKSAALYAVGIKIAEEVMVSGETNCFVSNGGKDVARKWLLLLQGGEDVSTGIYHKGKYGKALKNAVEHTIRQVQTLDTDCIECGGTRIVTSLP